MGSKAPSAGAYPNTSKGGRETPDGDDADAAADAHEDDDDADDGDDGERDDDDVDGVGAPLLGERLGGGMLAMVHARWDRAYRALPQCINAEVDEEEDEDVGEDDDGEDSDGEE